VVLFTFRMGISPLVNAAWKYPGRTPRGMLYLISYASLNPIKLTTKIEHTHIPYQEHMLSPKLLAWMLDAWLR
jgi:hypothetical protein